MFLEEIFVVNRLPSLFGPYENIFERILVHLLLNLDHIRLVHWVIAPEVRAVFLAAGEHRDDDELVEALVLLLREVESLQNFDVLQLV